MKNFTRAQSLEEAYELNQKKQNKILGGLLWLKMSRKNIDTGIDLSLLNLNKIEDCDDYVKIGSYVTLREFETSEILKTHFGNILTECSKNIVGVQFRNCATIGGSVFSRFGFSDILTALLCLDCYVQLYKGGVVSLSEFIAMPYDRDILLNIVIKKDGRRSIYQSQRLSKTDLPIIAVAVSKTDDCFNFSIGSTPNKAVLYKTKGNINEAIDYIENNINFGSNLRASAEYRKHLAKVFVKRAIKALED